VLLNSRKYEPGCSSRIRILIFFTNLRSGGQKGTGSGNRIFYPSRIPDPEVYKAPGPGSGSITLVNTCAIMCNLLYFQFMLSSRLWCGARRRSSRNWWSASRPRSGKSIRASPVSGGWARRSGSGPIRNGFAGSENGLSVWYLLGYLNTVSIIRQIPYCRLILVPRDVFLVSM
jgi:hypothetical protein